MNFTIISVIVLSLCCTKACNALRTSNSNACEIIKMNGTVCYGDDDSIVFMQNSKQLGNTATFHRSNNGKYLNIKCHSQFGIALDKLPNVDFNEVSTMEVQQCSFADISMLTKIKRSFMIKSVQKFVIQLTREKNIFQLSHQHFKGVEETENLEIITSDYIRFEENVFKHFSNLTTLKLQVHDIITLPYRVFKSLWKLETLEILNSGGLKNETKTLNFTLNSCINLKTFRMSGVRWPIHVLNLLSYNRRLTTVRIVGNRIKSLDENIFFKSSELEEISLGNNNIQELPAAIFSSQKNLIKLDLNGNQLALLDDDIFTTNSDLESLDLSNNRLNFTTRQLFLSLTKLTYLNLEHNQLSEVNFGSNLGAMKSLQTLMMSYNFIQNLCGYLECTQLQRLELKHNKLKRLFIDQFIFMSQKNLTIDLMENPFESVDFRDVKTSNKTANIAKLFINLDKEITCNCHTISLYEFLTSRLKMDSVIYEAVEVFPGDLKCLTTGSGTPESVKTIDETTLTCPLDFPHQKFCPPACHCDRRPYGKILMIACQNISIVPVLPPYRNLTDIKLDKIQLLINGNSINRLPNKKRDLNYNDVTEIYASHNNIRWIASYNIPDHLELLDVKYNQLQRLPTEVIVTFATLKYIHLKENPWNCSESIELIDFVKKHRDIVKDFNMIQCSNQQFFLEIDSDLKCGTRVLIAMLVLVSLVFVTGLILVYRLKKEVITEWIFMNDKHKLLERFYDRLKLFDAIMVVTEYDAVFAKYISTKLITKPNCFKIGLICKDWSPDQPIPEKVLKSLRNSRRVIVILSEHFEENNWIRWNYFNTNTRIIFISRKGSSKDFDINISNKITIKFGDPWFWDKLKYSMENRKELNVEENVELETEPLKCIA